MSQRLRVAFINPDRGLGKVRGYADKTLLNELAPIVLMIAIASVVGWVRLLPLYLIQNRAEQVARAKVRAQSIAAALSDKRRSPHSTVSDRRIDDWIKAHRSAFDNQRQTVAARLESDLTYAGDDGERHVYLGDFDSYHWLRMARNYLRSGSTCDEQSAGACRDSFANAPVGRQNIYAHSLHIAAIVLVHDIATKFRPAYPLAASSFLVPVAVAIIGVFPAFVIGRALAGNIGGLFVSLLIALNPLVLKRTIGSDDDIWNIVLPLFVVCALTLALESRRTIRRIAYSLIAAMFIGLHAATWLGWNYVYLVSVTGLVFAAIIELTRYFFKARSPQNVAAFRNTFTVLIVFYAASGLFTLPFGWDGFAIPISSAWRFARSWLEVRSALPPPDSWPQALASVAELAPMKLHAIVAAVGGPLYFSLAYAGLIAVFLPRTKLERWQYYLLGITVPIGLFLSLTGADVSRSLSIALLAMPICAAILLTLLIGGAADDELATGSILTLWFLTALYLSYGGARYAMLLVPSVAIAAGVLSGRLYHWLVQLGDRLWLAGTRFAAPALALALCGLVIPAVGDGYKAAHDYEPSMNSAWWNTLSKLKAESPPDSIVYTSWDYGYWTKFVAERRVSADGGSLLTHIPFWFAQALLAPSEREAVGLLRMLSCGSDATPLPEGAQGAYGKLVKYGLSGEAARAAIVHLASLDRDAAAAYLEGLGLPDEAVADVLASTHCTPPPAYLILTNAMPRSGGLWYSEQSLFTTDYSANRVVPARDGYSTDRWHECIQVSKSELLCRLDVPINQTETVDLVTFNIDDPQQTRLRVHAKKTGYVSAQDRERIPALIWFAGPEGIKQFELSSADEPDVGILMDVAKRRILVGPPYLIRSTFTDLIFLDGRYSKMFQKTNEQSGTHEERVTTWKINWPKN
ncbi:MAG TPA: STT3 domain-containing protein [Candidatus Binataceae bacterium]|nr:STT3 domain-containing protein [Candidatus Binataceae bacterium]